MVGVPDDQGIDAVKFGDQQLQHTCGVHFAQGVGGMGAEQDRPQTYPQAGSIFQPGGERWNGCGDALFARRTEGHARVGHQGESSQDDVRLLGWIKLRVRGL